MARTILQAKVTEGMFPNERFIEFTDSAGRILTFIVTESLVVEDKAAHGVEVRVLEKGAGYTWIYVPGEGFTSGSTVAVPDAQLLAVA